MGFEDFLDGRDERALQLLPHGHGATLLYRGWMFKESEYRRLHSLLQERGYSLFTNPDAYTEAHCKVAAPKKQLVRPATRPHARE